MPINNPFEVEFLDEALEFIGSLSPDEKKEVLANIKAARVAQNSKLFEKLTKDIWEFRARHNGNNIEYSHSGIRHENQWCFAPTDL